jgi:hypothetical protein
MMTEQIDMGASGTGPRPFREIPALWLRMPRMTAAFFAEERARTSTRNTWLGVLIATIFGAGGSGLQVLLTMATGTGSALAGRLGFAAAFFCVGLVGVPLSFSIQNGIYHVIAQALRGKAKFSEQAYAASLFWVPISLVGWLGWIPGLLPRVGVFLQIAWFIALELITLVFWFRVMRGSHGLATGSALAAVLIPFVLLLIPLCLIGSMVLAGPAIGNVFSSMNAELGTPLP